MPGVRVVVTTHGAGLVVGDKVGDLELTLENGFYDVSFTDPSGKYAPYSTSVAVNKGLLSTAPCMMLEILSPPPPQPPPAPTPVLKPDTVQLTFPDPTISEQNPKVWLWGQEVKFAGPHVGPVQIQLLVKYTTGGKEAFALQMRNPGGDWAGYVQKPGATSPVVADPSGVSGWQWADVGVFSWPSGNAYWVYAVHGSQFGLRDICSVAIMGIRFVRWIPSIP